MFGLRATYHTTSQATPMQLVYNQDAILNVKFQANWKFIKERKQKLIALNNKRENSKRIKHTYQIGDKILLQRVKQSKYGEPDYEGPYTILQVNPDSGTVTFQKKKYSDSVNIRQIIPYTGED